MIALPAIALRRIGLALAIAAPIAAAPLAAGAQELAHQNWSFDGPFGTFDRASAQRGFQIYNAVCSNCHSLKEAYYRNLSGIGLSDDQIKAVAASKSLPTIGDDGQPAERPGTPADHFALPFPNDKAARTANNGALPPDQSVIEKAREGGADYIYDLLNGYSDPPAGVKVGDGLYYNKAFPGHQIAMPQPLQDDSVEYTDGTKATLPQEARDITTFLTYIANPEMEQRKTIGVKIVLFLIGMTCVTYAVKRKIWADVH